MMEPLQFFWETGNEDDVTISIFLVDVNVTFCGNDVHLGI
jgi:hypothetical protein